MQLSEETTKPVINRLRRAHGQLAGGLKECLAGDDAELDSAKLEQMFLSLA